MDKTIEFKEPRKFVDDDDIADNVRFVLNSKGYLRILSSSLETVGREIKLDKKQIKRLIGFLKDFK